MIMTLNQAQMVNTRSNICEGDLNDSFTEQAFPGVIQTPVSLSASRVVDRIEIAPNIKPHSLWRESIDIVHQLVNHGLRKVKANECIYFNGDKMNKVYLISAGFIKIISITSDGREHPAGLFYRGDWLGFDGIPTGRYSCSAISLDVGELWSIDYENLLQVSAKEPVLLRLLMSAMGSQLAQNRDVIIATNKLPANSRVCDFLLQWAYSLEDRGLRTDQFNLYLSRADIGSYLGLRLESVSRALSTLVKQGLIEFNEPGRREISIPHLNALAEFIHNDIDQHGSLLQ